MSTTADVRVVRGACPHDCLDTCAMLVTVENGKATKVRGHPDHPFTRGGLCVRVKTPRPRRRADHRMTRPWPLETPQPSHPCDGLYPRWPANGGLVVKPLRLR